MIGLEEMIKKRKCLRCKYAYLNKKTKKKPLTTTKSRDSFFHFLISVLTDFNKDFIADRTTKRSYPCVHLVLWCPTSLQHSTLCSNQFCSVSSKDQNAGLRSKHSGKMCQSQWSTVIHLCQLCGSSEPHWMQNDTFQHFFQYDLQWKPSKSNLWNWFI